MMCLVERFTNIRKLEVIDKGFGDSLETYTLSMNGKLPKLEECIIDKKSSTCNFYGVQEKFEKLLKVPNISLFLRVVNTSFKDLQGYFPVSKDCRSYQVVKVRKAEHGLNLKYDIMVVRVTRVNGGPVDVITNKYYVK